MSKTKITNKCATNYKCTASIAALALLLVSNIYLYTQYNGQKTIIVNQELYIQQLKQDLANSEINDNTASKYFQKIFNHSWPNLRMPLWDADDMMDRKNSSSYYSSPSTDKSDAEYIITSILPGFNKEDISIELSNNILKIHAKNNDSGQVKESDQSIKIPNDIDPENIDVTLNNGVLKITISRIKDQAKQETKKLIIK